MQWWRASHDAQSIATERNPGTAEISTAGRWWRLFGMLAISALAMSAVIEHQLSGDRFKFWLDVGLGLVGYLVVPYRRRWPFSITLLLTVISAVSAIAAGPWTLAIVSLATRRVWSQIVVIGVLSLGGTAVFYWFQHLGDANTIVSDALRALVFNTMALGWGMYIGSRRDLVWTLQQRAERVEAEQDLRVASAQAAERTRIAREMHDVLAHRISRVSMQSGALAFREDLDSEQLRHGLRDIQDQSNQALAELRDVLGVLRGPLRGGGPTHEPLPTLRDIPGLIDEARATGMSIDASITLSEPASEQAGRTLYRIVQEGVTNAHKHAPGALLTIEITGTPAEGISFSLQNPLGFGRSTTPGAGLGLIGLDERARLGGGRIKGDVENGSFVLSGWIPWQL